ncbi:HlyD family efflux transporter periplasmic adaptor subunit [Oculatella sp. LEGE 06141]|uniref:HlyD family secretion protein n=1 Tax=Oculatella sp. LEGE 06141 TaxID=1828648 RepID=UPI00187E43A1|nr:HlyD family efflux transporter periplasmic adaptor subunit [Oculatella sp. LEGE 06141]MBE9180898.1 HlyD family efflux transporter periplasmic adaptor subunit [Oculatella sp. LEGE 06141]
MVKPDAPLSLRSLKQDEFLPPISRWTSLGGFILIGAVGVAVILASLLKYNVTVRAAALVRPSGELRLVQAEIDGTVSQIDVQENQAVQQGDVIAQLDRTPLEIQQARLQASIQQRQLQLTQMEAQVLWLDTQIAAESRAIDRAIAVAQSELNRTQRDYREQQVNTQATLTEAEAAVEFARSEMQRYQQLVDSGAVSQLQVEEKQAAVKTAEAQLARARAGLNPTTASVAIAQEQMAQEQSRGNATIATLNRERETLMQQRLEIQTQMIQEQTDLQPIANALQKTTVRAPHSGIILRLNLRNVDQVINAGSTIAEIAPDRTATTNSSLVIKATIASQDIDTVKPGQRVQLRVTACPYPDYGTLKGVVMAVSPDAIAPSDASTNGLNTPTMTASSPNQFEVTIQPESLFLSSGGNRTALAGTRQCQLQSGMDAEASIIARSETFLQFLLRTARLTTSV